jgi:hypothetical protein
MDVQPTQRSRLRLRTGRPRRHDEAGDRSSHRGFREGASDIEIRSEAISFSEIARQLALRVRAGNPPDVAQLAGNDTFVIAATGKLEPLNAYVGGDLKSHLKPDAVAGCNIKAS